MSNHLFCKKVIEEYEHLKKMVSPQDHELIDMLIAAAESGKKSYYEFSMWLDENPDDIISANLTTPDNIIYNLIEENDERFEYTIATAEANSIIYPSAKNKSSL